MPNNHQRRTAQYRKIGQAISERGREWRVALGLSPNPWGVAKSQNFDVMQIITRAKLSRLERRSLETDDETVK